MKRTHLFWPLLGYTAISMILFGGNIADGIFNMGADPTAYIWFLNWWPYAITNGLDPFFTHAVWEPTGFSLMWSTSVPALAILGAPLTAIAGAVVTFNVLTLAAPALSAFTFYILLLHFECRRPAAFVGGFLFGFSSYALGQMLGHLSLEFVAIIPLFVLLVVKRVRHDIGRGSFIASLTICAVLQFGISHELLATSAFVALLAYMAFYVRYRQSVDLAGLAVDSGISAALSLLVLGLPLYYMFRDASQVPAIIHGAKQYSADLLNFVVPTPVTAVGGAAFERIAVRFPGNYSEEGAYLGIPLLVTLILAIHRFWSTRWLLPLLAVLLGTVVLSLGPDLQIAGKSVGIPLPWRIVEHIPIMRHALPTRFTLYVSFVVALLVALWLSSASLTKLGRSARGALATLAVLAILPNPDWFIFTAPDTPRIFQPDSGVTPFEPDDTILVLPYAQFGNSMLWQTESGMAFKMASGYLGFPPRRFTQLPANGYFSGSPMPADPERFNSDVSAFCMLNGVRAIVIAPGTEPNLRARLEALPWERRTDSGTTILMVPPDLNAPYMVISGDYFGSVVEAETWMGKRIEVTNASSKPRELVLMRRYIPSRVGPFDVTVTLPGKATHYRLEDADIVIAVPAHSVMYIESNKTWNPKLYLKNDDERDLSFVVRVNPAPAQ
jgi:hypothetical protein